MTCRGLAFSICSERPMPIFSHDRIGPTLLSLPSMCLTPWSPFRDQLQALHQDLKIDESVLSVKFYQKYVCYSIIRDALIMNVPY